MSFGKVRMSDNLSGWLIIDKPLGISSTHVGNKVRRALGIKKVGHLGTLDPLATGVLPLALGEATKAIPYLTDDTKEYEFQVCFGSSTTTDDREGEVVLTSSGRPTKDQILLNLNHFTGDIEQIPPQFSAIKIDGNPAYKLARRGESVEIPKRSVTIFSLTLLCLDDEDHATFRVSCSSGTYVRSLARDMSLALGTVGHVSILRRTRAGKFLLNQSISLPKFLEMSHKDKESALHLIGTVLDDIPAVTVSNDEARQLRQGLSLNKVLSYEGIVQVLTEGQLLCMARSELGVLSSIRLFHL